MKKNEPLYMEGVGYFISATEGFRTYANDGFSKAISNTQRPSPPKPSESAYKSTTFLSMIGKVAGTAVGAKEMTETTLLKQNK